jgi:hypothetical protein
MWPRKSNAKLRVNHGRGATTLVKSGEATSPTTMRVREPSCRRTNTSCSASTADGAEGEGKTEGEGRETGRVREGDKEGGRGRGREREIRGEGEGLRSPMSR